VLGFLLVMAAFVWTRSELKQVRRSLEDARERRDLILVWITGVEKTMIKAGLDPDPIPSKLYEEGK